jgi:hypothetical protein
LGRSGTRAYQDVWIRSGGRGRGGVGADRRRLPVASNERLRRVGAPAAAFFHHRRLQGPTWEACSAHRRDDPRSPAAWRCPDAPAPVSNRQQRRGTPARETVREGGAVREQARKGGGRRTAAWGRVQRRLGACLKMKAYYRYYASSNYNTRLCSTP